jgi:hypothetical protein
MMASPPIESLARRLVQTDTKYSMHETTCSWYHVNAVFGLRRMVSAEWSYMR